MRTAGQQSSKSSTNTMRTAGQQSSKSSTNTMTTAGQQSSKSSLTLPPIQTACFRGWSSSLLNLSKRFPAPDRSVTDLPTWIPRHLSQNKLARHLPTDTTVKSLTINPLSELLPADVVAKHLPIDKPTKHVSAEKPPKLRPSDSPTKRLPIDSPAKHLPTASPTKHLSIDKPVKHLPTDTPAKHLSTGKSVKHVPTFSLVKHLSRYTPAKPLPTESPAKHLPTNLLAKHLLTDNNGAGAGSQRFDHARVVNPASDFRRIDRSPERKHQSLPPPRLNGYLVTSEYVGRDGVTYYAQGGAGKDHNSTARRQQSLPSKRTEAEDKQRQSNSAPARKDRAANQNQGSPLPKLNTLVARSRGPGGETSHVFTTSFAGFSTKEQEASPTKSSRFASTWAQVRAENHIDMCATTSPDGSPRKTGPEEDRSNAASRLRHPKTTSPDRESTKGSNPRSRVDFVFHALPARDKENVKPTPPKKEPPPAISPRTIQATKKKSREEKEKQTIRFITPEDERDGTDHQNGEADTEEVPDTQRPVSQGNRNIKQKPQWDNRLALSVPQPTQPPVKSWRRYEAELTHMPTVTSNKQVYKAYTGHSKQHLRDKQVTEDNDFSEQRPSTKGSSRTEEGDLELKESEPHPQKEHILTRREAKMYIHLQNVYGSEAFRHQRKEWFFKKLTDVQVQELKQQAADKRRMQQKREESKKRQQRQLMYVRRKFRREQLHRFRTQYVTSRVLEYERGDRDMYGLPGDSDDDDSFNGSIGNKGSQAEDTDRKDSSHQDQTPDKKSPEKSNESAVNTSRTHATQPDNSQHSVTTNTPKTGASESKTAVNPAGDGPTDNGPGSKDKANVAGSRSKTSPNKDSKQVNGDSLHTQDTGKSNPRSANTKNSRPAPNNNSQTSNSKPSTVSQGKSVTNSEQTENVIPSSNTNEQNGNNSQKDFSRTGDTGPGTKTSPNKGKQEPEQVSPAKGAVTTTSPRKGGNTSSNPQNPPATTNTKADKTGTSQASDGVAKKPSDNSSPPTSHTNTGASTIPGDVASKGTAGPHPAESSQSKTAAPKGQDGKTDSKQTNPKGTEDKNKGDSLQEKNGKEDTAQTNNSLNNDKNNNVKNNETTNTNRDDNTPNKKVSVTGDNNKRTTITKDAKGRYITTTRNFGPKDPPPNTVSSNNHLTNGHVSDSKDTPTKQNPHKPAAHTKQDDTTNKTARSNRSPTRAVNSRGGKRRSTTGQPKSEAEQKKQMEKKFGKMFGKSSGPSWNPGAKPPKMEGIDTVMIKVTDEKGRTRMKKRDVKDVVKEAKDQLAVPVPGSPRRSGGKGAHSTMDQSNTIRPASADTLDFDDDDEDDDEEDVFERVRRKYNLQIDSDDDDSTV